MSSSTEVKDGCSTSSDERKKNAHFRPASYGKSKTCNEGFCEMDWDKVYYWKSR